MVDVEACCAWRSTTSGPTSSRSVAVRSPVLVHFFLFCQGPPGTLGEVHPPAQLSWRPAAGGRRAGVCTPVPLDDGCAHAPDIVRGARLPSPLTQPPPRGACQLQRSRFVRVITAFTANGTRLSFAPPRPLSCRQTCRRCPQTSFGWPLLRPTHIAWPLPLAWCSRVFSARCGSPGDTDDDAGAEEVDVEASPVGPGAQPAMASAPAAVEGDLLHEGPDCRWEPPRV